MCCFSEEPCYGQFFLPQSDKINERLLPSIRRGAPASRGRLKFWQKCWPKCCVRPTLGGRTPNDFSAELRFPVQVEWLERVESHFPTLYFYFSHDNCSSARYNWSLAITFMTQSKKSDSSWDKMESMETLNRAAAVRLVLVRAWILCQRPREIFLRVLITPGPLPRSNRNSTRLKEGKKRSRNGIANSHRTTDRRS